MCAYKRDAPNNEYSNNDIPRIGSALQFELQLFRMIENGRVSGRRLQRSTVSTWDETAPNSEYAPISEMRLITRHYGNLIIQRLHHCDVITGVR